MKGKSERVRMVEELDELEATLNVTNAKIVEINDKISAANIQHEMVLKRLIAQRDTLERGRRVTSTMADNARQVLATMVYPAVNCCGITDSSSSY
jgi:hypothetical protein